MKLNNLLKPLLPIFILLSLVGCSTPASVVDYFSTSDGSVKQSELPEGAIPFQYGITTLYNAWPGLQEALTSPDAETDIVLVILNISRPEEGSLLQVSELSGERTGRILAQFKEIASESEVSGNQESVKGHYFINATSNIVYAWFSYQGIDYTIQTSLQKTLRISDTVYLAGRITKGHQAPVAKAGEDGSIRSYGETVQLDGSASYSPAGLTINKYKWTLETPEGSSTTLDDPISATPTFISDAYGDYTASLIAYDALGIPSHADSVIYSLSNLPPTSNAGSDKLGVIGDSVLLNGSGIDPEGEPLNYTWTLTSSPDGSSPVLSNVNSANANLYVDAIGSYTASLIINDGVLDSDVDTVNIEVVSIHDGLTNSLVELSAVIDSIPLTSLANENLANTFTSKLNVIVKAINKGNYTGAINKLKNDIISKTDGCSTKGAPDKNDYVTDCDSQTELHELLKRVESLMIR